MNEVDSRLDILQRRYHASLSTKRYEIETAWLAVRADSRDLDHRTMLAGLVHRLAGSAESYGYVEVGNLAERVDSMLGSETDKLGTRTQIEAVERVLENALPVIECLLAALQMAADSPPRDTGYKNESRADPS